MKKNQIFLMTYVLAAMTACSSDDIPENVVPSGDNSVLNVEVESLQYEDDDATRSAYDAANNQLYWQQGDRICVYEKNLYDCDVYSFQASQRAFVPVESETNITTEATYALAPEEYVYMPGWTTKGVKAIFQMPSLVVYNSSSEDVSTASGKTLYSGNLPMWGKATGDFGNISLSMKYLSAVMRLNLKGAKGKVTYVKVSSESIPLSGGLEIVIADKKRVTNENCQLQEGTSSLSTKGYILVDLRSAPSNDAIVFLPIVPAEYDDLTVSYTDGYLGYDEDGNLVEDSIDDVVWKTIKVYPKGKQMKRGGGYSVTTQF